MLVQIHISDLKKPPALKFPERCANCGKSKDEILGLSLNMGTQYRGKPVVLQMKVPMCKACADKERGIGKVTYIPFLIVGFIFGAIAFVPAMLVAPQGVDAQTVGFPLVVGGFAGLIVGSLVGTVAEIIVKSLSIPVYGKLVTRRPLTVLALFSDTDEMLGIFARFFRDKKMVQLEFENETIAQEFLQLNHLENQ